MLFDAFFTGHIAPLYASSIDQVRLKQAKAHIWQLFWMVLLSILVGLCAFWFSGDWRIALIAFGLSLVMSEVLYVQSYPYPKFERPGFFVYLAMCLFCIGGSALLVYAIEVAIKPIIYVFGSVMILVSVLTAGAQNPYRAALLRPYAELRSEVIQLFLGRLFPDLYLVTPTYIAVDALAGLQIFGNNFDEIESGEALAGKLNNNNIYLQKIKLIRVTKNNKGQSSRSTVFEGFWISLPNLHQNTTPVIVRKHRSAQVIDIFVEDTHRIEMENPEFEQYFDAVASNEFEARRILTPVMMEQLSYFAQNAPALQGVYWGFGQIHLAVKTNITLFEEDFAHEAKVRKALNETQEVLDAQLEMILALDKNG